MASPSSSSKVRKVKSKWEDDDGDDPLLDNKPIKKKKKIKNFTSTLQQSASSSRPGSSSGGLGSMSPLTGQSMSHNNSAVNSPLGRSSMNSSSGASRHPPLQGCRSVYAYEKLNHIEEGSYGVVSRAREKETGDIVALKKLKMDQEKNGFPITSLREIKTLMTVGNHPNIVRVREIVVGDTLTQVFIVMEYDPCSSYYCFIANCGVYSFIEHDLKSLLSTMRSPFLISEVKTLMQQLLSAIAYCHDNWIVHRDLKTSNLLMNNRGQIKLADFGLARTYGEPLGDMTQLVVTLWYRAPELLLGETEYSTAVDMWSIGCIMGELIQKEPLMPGKGEIDQMNLMFKLLGRPSEEIWPGFSKLPNAKSLNLGNVQPYSNLRAKFRYTTDLGVDLMQKLLCYDPKRRISAEEALKHPWFAESPLPKHPDMFQSFPSIAAGDRKRTYASPSAPHRQVQQADKYELII